MRAFTAVFSALFAALAVLAACSSPPPTFSLAAATVDPAYWCPGGSNNAAYMVHATIQARNDTAQDVTIDSATAEMVLTAVKGSWLEQVGDRYDAAAVDVAPKTVARRSSARLTVTIPSACTSALYGSGTSSSGDYEVRMRLVTSAGTFSVTAGNTHEIRAA